MQNALWIQSQFRLRFEMLMIRRGGWGPRIFVGSALDPPWYSHNNYTSNRKATLQYNAEGYKMSTDDTILTGPPADNHLTGCRFEGRSW